MNWIWQKDSWPNFEYDAEALLEFEHIFQRNVGIVFGTITHLNEEDKEAIQVQILTQEAISTSSIEGEILQRDSVQSSIRKHLGLKSDNRKIEPITAGIAELHSELYKNYDLPLSKNMICDWHKMVTNGRRDLDVIGEYRKHTEPIQIVSGNYDNQKVFYEAPPSSEIEKEMDSYIKWFNTNAMDKRLPTLVFAGIAHLYFELIHPFEDGNGRIGRAIVEKAISQRIRQPSLNSLSKIIELKKKQYYQALQESNNNINIKSWLRYFAETSIASQEYTIQLFNFVIQKSKFFAKFGARLNARQEKVVLRMYAEGLEGFKGGLSASNYQSICNTSASTATRDLQELATIGALQITGELKSTRYFLSNYLEGYPERAKYK